MDWTAALPSDVLDARWVTTDGYSDSVYRSRTDAVIVRTGVHSETAGFSPGFYTNASVEWDLKTDTVRVIDVVPWGGGSYGRGSLLDGYWPNKAPSPRHTYDGICYVPETDEMYLMLGAYGRIHGSSSRTNGSNSSGRGRSRLPVARRSFTRVAQRHRHPAGPSRLQSIDRWETRWTRDVAAGEHARR